VFEIWQGTQNIVNPEKRERISLLLESLGMFPFDVLSAKEAGSIHALLKKERTLIDPEDSMIAGITKIHHETLLTRNMKHFSRIKHLPLETY